MDGNYSFSKKPTHTPIQQTDMALVALTDGDKNRTQGNGLLRFWQYLQDDMDFKHSEVWPMLQSQAGITVSWEHQHKTKFT